MRLGILGTVWSWDCRLVTPSEEDHEAWVKVCRREPRRLLVCDRRQRNSNLCGSANCAPRIRKLNLLNGLSISRPTINFSKLILNFFAMRVGAPFNAGDLFFSTSNGMSNWHPVQFSASAMTIVFTAYSVLCPLILSRNRWGSCWCVTAFKFFWLRFCFVAFNLSSPIWDGLAPDSSVA